MADELSFPPIASTTPEVVAPTPPATYDSWALNRCEIKRNKNSVTGVVTYDVATNWIIGRILPDGTFENGPTGSSFVVRDILNGETILQHPEIAQISPGFIAGLVAIGKRLGKL